MTLITERVIQHLLMNRAMHGKMHAVIIPNIYLFRPGWESDLISVTRANLIHEYEIKISKADFNRDLDKRWKHMLLSKADTRGPSYFWYVTHGFEPGSIPNYAGWIRVVEGDHHLRCEVIKEAPRLHSIKLGNRQLLKIARGLSFRLTKNW